VKTVIDRFIASRQSSVGD